MPSLAVHNLEGKKIEDFNLPEEIFGGKINQDVLHQAVVMYHACQRQGNAASKERGSVSGGGKKPWRQKGTGQARAGSTRSPLWRGGGVVFGPNPRDFSYSVPKKVRQAALRESLNSRFISNDLFCVDKITVASPKTKEFVKILTTLKLKGKVLAVLDKQDKDVVLSCRNIAFLNYLRSEDVTAYDILRSNKLLVTKGALNQLIKRVQ